MNISSKFLPLGPPTFVLPCTKSNIFSIQVYFLLGELMRRFFHSLLQKERLDIVACFYPRHSRVKQMV